MPAQDALWFGTAWHVVWANYYIPGRKRGKDPHETWDEQMKFAHALIPTGDYSEDKERDWVDAVPLGHAMIDGQLKEWNGDPGWEVLSPEHRFATNVPFNARQIEAKLPYMFYGNMTRHITRLVGSIDVTIRDHNDGRIKVVDWKSAAQYDAVSAWLTKDDQVGTYLSVGTAFLRTEGLIGPNEEVTGGIWSYARKQMPPDPATLDDQGRKRNKPQKKHFIECYGNNLDFDEKWPLPKMQAYADAKGGVVLGDVSKVQPLKLFWREEVARNKANRRRQIERIADDAEQIELVRRGLMGITKAPGKHCNWCKFKDLCDVDENGGDSEQYIKDVFRVEDKYSDHRAGAKNSKVTT